MQFADVISASKRFASLVSQISGALTTSESQDLRARPQRCDTLTTAWQTQCPRTSPQGAARDECADEFVSGRSWRIFVFTPMHV